jgi:hypothetical protein
MTLTIPTLPHALVVELEKRAKAEGRTVEEVAISAITKGLHAPNTKTSMRDLTGVAGTMSKEDAEAINDAVRWMDDADLAARP